MQRPFNTSRVSIMVNLGKIQGWDICIADFFTIFNNFL